MTILRSALVVCILAVASTSLAKTLRWSTQGDASTVDPHALFYGNNVLWKTVDGPFSVPPGPNSHSTVVALTQELTRAVEHVVRAHPEYWFWVHRRWKTRPAAEATLPARDNP